MGRRVDAVEDQVRSLIRSLVFVERAGVRPGASAHPLDLVLVRTEERVRDQARGQEIGVDTAGDTGGDPGPVVVEAPALAELDGVLHGAAPIVRLSSDVQQA